MRWVMDVCPFRLLKGRMASWRASAGLLHVHAWGKLTDSAMASSSPWRNFFEPLCCFFAAWLFLGAGDARDDAPAPKLLPPLRLWPWLSPVAMKLGCVCAGESWPEDAWALDAVGMAGGFDDMVVPPAAPFVMTKTPASGGEGREGTRTHAMRKRGGREEEGGRGSKRMQ